MRWIDAPAAASTSKRKIVGEVQKLTLEQWKVYEASKHAVKPSDGARGAFRILVGGHRRYEGIRRSCLLGCFVFLY